MKIAYTNEQIRKMDAEALKTVRVTELMERAGRALADRVRVLFSKLSVSDVLFVCGSGNNGGDGFVAARILQETGVDVSVLCAAEKLTPACALAKARFNGDILGIAPRRRYALIVDCLFGTGIARAPEGMDAVLINWMNDSGAYILACDLPSGLSEGGIAFRPCVKASETLSIGGLKSALILNDGADCAGEVIVCDIGLKEIEHGTEIWDKSDVAACFPKKKSHTNKGDYGRASIVAGDRFSGAAFLAAGACLKSGAGYTQLFVSDEHYPASVGKLPACVLSRLSNGGELLLSSDCIAIGMGMGVSERLYNIIKSIVKEFRGTLLLDADALNAVAAYGTDVLKDAACQIVLTPHIGEFARLCGLSVDEILLGGEKLVSEFARSYGVTLVLKNNRTFVTDGKRTAIVQNGSPVLAKGGSGDVLAGLLAGTIARKIPLFDAAVCSSYLLGEAGRLAEEEFGTYAPSAEDILNYLPYAIKNME